MRSPGATVRKRLVWLMSGFFLLFLCVVLRLADLQIGQAQELTQRGMRQWTRSGLVSARRGSIVDTKGRMLAQSMTSFVLSASPREVTDPEGLAEVLKRELGLDRDAVIEKLRKNKNAASVTLRRQVMREDVDRLRAIMADGRNADSKKLAGISFDEDVSRWYPMGSLLAQVLGLCNVDGEGQSGLELQYDDVLSGTPGRITTEVDARARTLPDGMTSYIPAKAGNTLRLTIDREVQSAVERAVRECAQVNEAERVQAIAMDVNTGAESMKQALQNSCNPVFTQLALRLGSDRFYRYLTAFGLGARTGIGLQGEASGILIPKTRVKDVDLARIGFGQSVAVTPIQMITAACAVVNGGRLMKPYIVAAVESPQGEVVQRTYPKVVANPIRPETSVTMRALLESVVAEGGGKNAQADGYRVGGKTGTAQIYKNGKIEANLHIGSFVGFAPADDPKVAVLVIVDEAQVKPDYGGTTAAPFAAQIFTEILPLLGIEKTQAGGAKAPVTMPDVTGMNTTDAAKILREIGIDCVTDGSARLVTGQLPPAGAGITEGFCAMLYVTGNSAPTAENYALVPDVLGLPVRESAQALRENGLELHAEGTGIAVSQSPVAGKYARTGSVVTVTFESP